MESLNISFVAVFFFHGDGSGRGAVARDHGLGGWGLHGNVGAAASRLGAGGGVRGVGREARAAAPLFCVDEWVDGGVSRSSLHTAGVGRLRQ